MKKFFFISVILFLVPALLFANERAIPMGIAFQSALYDEGGNPLPDGEVDVIFRIKDELGQVLYEETKRPNILHGIASVLIGDAADIAIYDPIAPRFLEVEVSGMTPMGPMEITSVPYAYYASEALHVAEGGVDSRAIADGSIAYEDLSRDLIIKLSNSLFSGKSASDIVFKSDMDSFYRNPQSAGNVGVLPKFIYSASNNLQGALEDMDRAIKRRDEKITVESEERKAAITNESAARHEADASESAARSAAIAVETGARQGADAQLQSNINAEINGRMLAVDNLNASVMASESARAAHSHDAPLQGGSLLFNPATGAGAIHIAADYVSDNSYVQIPNPFSGGECKIITSVKNAVTNNLEKTCTRSCLTGNQYRIRCVTGDSNNCDTIMSNCENPQIVRYMPCEASYLMICVRSY